MLFRVAGISPVHRDAKKKYRPESDLARAYGYAALPRLSPPDEHERRFGIYLNLSRSRSPDALTVAKGVAIVLGGPPDTFFDEITENARESSRLSASWQKKGSARA